jgi:nucleoside 2-deoxyribosyltransferase
MVKVYLAGPEVFVPNAREVLDRKIALARAAGFEPLAPGDLEIPPAPTRREFGENIYRVDEQLMMSADAIIANLTPFRGLHADVGTVFEVGFMRGRGKPVFAYSNITDTYYERLLGHYDGQVTMSPNGQMRGSDGMLVEDFEMNENLMLDGAIAAGGGAWETRDVPDARLYVDTSAFEAVLISAAHRLLGR